MQIISAASSHAVS